MGDVEQLRQERTQIFHDVFDNKIPKRVPINVNLTLEVVAGYAGVDGKEAAWHPEILMQAADELCQKVPSDICVFGGTIRMPDSYQALESNNFKMNKSGLMQHPNTVGLLPEEYDDFIENPIDCLIEKILPRNYSALDIAKDPVRAMFALNQGMTARNQFMMKNGAIIGALTQKYGYYAADPAAKAMCYAPLDILTDNMRSLSGMCMDLRRKRDKIAAAVEAVYPLNYMVGIPKKISNYGQVFFPLHLATYMKEKDFEKLWWEPFLRQANDYASLGLHMNAFCEHDWMRYLDYLYEMPTDTYLTFEMGDAKLVKEKLGKKHILAGLFPLGMLRTATKQECIDYTKEFLDIMMPDGKFIFQFDKGALTYNDINLENLIAVCETVRDYGVYTNAGETAGMQFNKEDYTHSEVAPIQSKYYRTWKQYQQLNPETPESAREIVMNLENDIIKYLYFLCE